MTTSGSSVSHFPTDTTPPPVGFCRGMVSRFFGPRMSVLASKGFIPHALFSAHRVLLTLSAFAAVPHFTSWRITNPRVFIRKFVTSFAMGFSGIGRGRPHSTKQVFSISDWLYVDGIYAKTIPAKMVAVQSLRNSLYEQFINNFMSAILVIPNTERSVAVRGVDIRSPFPTRNALVRMLGRYFDFGKESGEKFTIDDARINSRHIISLIDSVFRLARKVQTSWRAAFILAQNPS